MFKGKLRRDPDDLELVAAPEDAPEPEPAEPPDSPAPVPSPRARSPQGGTTVEIRDTYEVIGGKRYRTEGSTLLASDTYWDGRSNERMGRNTYLFRTPKGSFFMLLQTRWERERDCITPLPRDEALKLFEELPVKAMEYEEAFPGIAIEDA